MERIVKTLETKTGEHFIFAPGEPRRIVLDESVLPLPFRIERLIIDDEVARYFLVTGIQVGYNHQFGMGALPATLFSRASVVRSDFDLIPLERTLSIDVVNKSRDCRVLIGSVVGHRAEPGEHRPMPNLFLYGLGSTVVAGNSSANIITQPNAVFRPSRLVVSSDVAQHFRVGDIKIHGFSQLRGATGSVPATMFAEDVEVPDMRMDQASPGDFVSVSVENVAAEPREFEGALAGFEP